MKTKYRTEIHYKNGLIKKFSSEQQALRNMAGLIVSDVWESLGIHKRRKLVWWDEQDAESDDGQKAYAQIMQIEES